MTTSPPSVPPSALILGAGWLGQALAESLAADGVRVTTVRRSAHASVPGGAAVAFDLAEIAGDDAALAELPTSLRGHDVMIAAVAPDRSRGDDHASTYPVAAQASVRIAQRTGARALSWISSTGVYGYVDGREVTEETPRRGHGAAHDALCQAEDTILAAASSILRVGVLRVAGLYGPGRDPAPRYRDMSAFAGRSAHWLNLAWRDDVIAAIRVWTSHALSGGPTPAVLNVADGTPLTMAECARLVAQADGRAFVPPPDAPDGAAVAPTRSNQRIRIDALRALGWSPEVPNLRVGLLRLGYTRLALDAQPYGPHTADIRAFLRALAGLSVDAHAQVLDVWARESATTAFARADRVLADTMVRVNREAERDAAAGPLLQMMRSGDDESTTLDPIAEPALAALMALVLRDVLPTATFDTLVVSMASTIPAAHAV